MKDKLIYVRQRKSFRKKGTRFMGILTNILFGESFTSNKFKIGDFVKIKLTGEEGQIVDIHGNIYGVEVNKTHEVYNYKENEIERLF